MKATIDLNMTLNLLDYNFGISPHKSKHKDFDTEYDGIWMSCISTSKTSSREVMMFYGNDPSVSLRLVNYNATYPDGMLM